MPVPLLPVLAGVCCLQLCLADTACYWLLAGSSHVMHGQWAQKTRPRNKAPSPTERTEDIYAAEKSLEKILEAAMRSFNSAPRLPAVWFVTTTRVPSLSTLQITTWSLPVRPAT